MKAPMNTESIFCKHKEIQFTNTIIFYQESTQFDSWISLQNIYMYCFYSREQSNFWSSLL